MTPSVRYVVASLGCIAVAACSRASPVPGATAPRVAEVGISCDGGLANADASFGDASHRDGRALLEESDRCFADPTCPFDRGAHLYAEAARGGAREVTCWRFYEGVGAPQDPALARTCLTRTIQRRGSRGPTSDIDALRLARMMKDGDGGPVDEESSQRVVPNAAALAAFRVEEAQVKAGALSPLELCDRHATEGWTHGECMERERARSDFAVYAWERRALGDAGADLASAMVAARAGWDTLTLKIGLWSADAYRGGSLSESQVDAVAAQMASERATALASLGSRPPSADDLGRQEGLLASTVARLGRRGDAEHRLLFRAIAPAWSAYRAAEHALYARVLGAPDAGLDALIDANLAGAERARLEAIDRATRGN